MGVRRSAGRRLEVVASHPHQVAEEAAYRDPVGRLAEDRLEEAAYRDPAHHPAEEVVSGRRLVAAAVACSQTTSASWHTSDPEPCRCPPLAFCSST